MEKIKVEAKFEFPAKVLYDMKAKPVFLIIDIKGEGKDGFSSTVKIPIGDVSTEEFAKAAKVLQLVAHSFYHQQYARLREEEKDGEES